MALEEPRHAPTNLAVQGIVEEVLARITLENGALLFIQAPANELVPKTNGIHRWEGCRLEEIFVKYIQDDMPEADNAFIKEYVGRRIDHDGNEYHEAEAIRQAIKGKQPRMIDPAAHIFFDELFTCF
ncbi:unnamed protein product [Enterobius vermicularis]|uniref:Nucleoside-diphosphate kinase n=1 Tax=Enterobius vermicularis TaxID=51028 RepID=A0A0N4V141_ENTVE|nr:unnamed protein product [Enterobius vermicularis]